MARAIGASFRVQPAADASPPGQTLSEIVSKLPISTPPIALAPQAHLRGALAQIIRDPNAQYSTIIVLAEESFDDNVYQISKYLLSKDRKFVPEATSKRVLSLLPNQMLRLETDGKTRWARSRIAVQRVSARAAGLRRRGEGARTIAIDGIGNVKLVFDPNAP